MALLPDTIQMLLDPLTLDCSEKTVLDSVMARVTTIIPNSTETYHVTWSYRGDQQGTLLPKGKKVTSSPA